MRRFGAASRANHDEVIPWLLEGDPAIRWQVLRDLLGAAELAVERERRKVARGGWGAELLARQDREGTWAGGLYSPKWTSTTYTMLKPLRLSAAAGTRMAAGSCNIPTRGKLIFRSRNRVLQAGGIRSEPCAFCAGGTKAPAELKPGSFRTGLGTPSLGGRALSVVYLTVFPINAHLSRPPVLP